jgi:hypothetical protein
VARAGWQAKNYKSAGEIAVSCLAVERKRLQLTHDSRRPYFFVSGDLAAGADGLTAAVRLVFIE